MEKTQWERILPNISQAVDHHRYETWFKPLVQINSDDSSILVLSAPNNYFRDFLDQHYSSLILSMAGKIFPYISEVRFVVKGDAQPSAGYPYSVTSHYTDSSRPTTSLNPMYTFDLFIAGQGNEFAKSVSLAVAEAPGLTKFNPLLIYGGVGLGKTHLLHAIANHVSHKNREAVINYVSAEEFYFSFIEAIKNNNTKSFSEKYRKSSILLIDDIQFLEGKETTQEEFFFIFNSLYQGKRQIVMSSDLPPASIKGLQDRLVSRFQWGLCVDIQPPDLETRVAIIQKKSERENLNISEDILYFIAENVSSNIREIESVLIKLLAFSSITNTDISLDLVKGMLKENTKKSRVKISIDEIIDKVADYYKIPSNTIREKNRRKEVAQCRQVAMYMAKSITNHSLKSIGLHFGGRDHSTVIHAVQNIENLQKTDENIRKDINYISSIFKCDNSN
jgi:chromosomal replication initiator protein